MRQILEPGCRLLALALLLVTLGALAVLWALFVEPRLLTVTRREVPVTGLPDGLDGTRIVLLSDLHGARFGARQGTLAVIVRRLEPHAIVFAGDLIDANRGGLGAGVELLQALGEIAPTYIIWGNHDYIRDLAKLRQAVDESGAKVHDLDLDWARLEIGGETLLLCGLSRSWRGGGEGLAEQAAEARRAAGPTAPMVVVAHSPGPAALARAAEVRADLVLAGHTHGGQVRLPLIGALWSPVEGALPEHGLVQGLHPIESGHVFITRGLGTSVLPVRFLCPPEIALLTLRTSPGRR